MKKNIRKVLIAAICLAMTVGGASPGFAKDAQVSLNGLTDYVTAADSVQGFLSGTVSSEKQKSLALMKNQRFDEIDSGEAYSEESTGFDAVKSLRSGGIASSSFDLMEDQVNSGGSGSSGSSGGGVGAIGGSGSGGGGIGGSGSSVGGGNSGAWMAPPSGGASSSASSASGVGGASGGGSAPSNDTEVMDYHATEGDWAIPIYPVWGAAKRDAYWSKAILIPISGEEEIYLDFFWTAYFGGVLFLEDIPAGRYRIIIDGQELTRSLKVIGKAEKYAISAGNMLPTAFYADQPNDFMQDVFKYPRIYDKLRPTYERLSYGYSDEDYYLYADGKLYFSVYGVNLAVSDISAVTARYGSGNTTYATLEKIIPGRSAGNSVRELVLVMNPVSKTLSPPAEIKFNIQFKPGVNSPGGNQITESLWFVDSPQYYVDTTHINDLRIDLLLPESIYSAPELSCSIGIMDMKTYTSNRHLDGRYTFAISQKIDEYWPFGYDEIYLNPLPPLNAARTLITTEDIIAISLEDEIITDIDGKSFFVFPESIRGLSREDAVFSLAYDDFTPVNGVTIERTKHTWYNEYTFKTNSILPSGYYYLMMGKFPLKSIYLWDSISLPPHASYVSSNSFLYESQLLNLDLSGVVEDLIPNEWKLVLTNLKTNDTITLTPADGSLQARENEVDRFISTKELPPGIYSKTYYKNDVEISYTQADYQNYYNYNYLLVKPDETSLYIYEGRTDTDEATSASAFFLFGSAPRGSDISGLKVETFKTTVPFIDPQSISVTNLSTTGLNSDGYFTGYAYARELKINEPGLYWFVVTDQSGNVIYTTQDYFTKTSLEISAPLTASISGKVTLSNQPVAVNVELWNGSTKLKSVTSTADGSFSFTDLPTGVKYTVKIPAGSTWQAFSQDCDLIASDINLQVTLTATAGSGPVAGGGGLVVNPNNSGGGGGGGGGSSSGVVAPVTTKPAITTGTAVNTSAPAVSTGTDIGAASQTDGIAPLASFSDASRIAPWATAFFERLIKEGIISGRDNGTLDPKGYVTRAEFTKMTVLAMDIKAGSEILSFEDVKASAWYKEYVDLASSNGIVQGVSGSSFAPNANITRQDLCTIVYRALTHVNAKLPEAEALSFSDSDSIGSYAGDAVAALKQLDIISGRDDGRFDPAAFATREETAKIICGIMDYLSISAS